MKILLYRDCRSKYVNVKTSEVEKKKMKVESSLTTHHHQTSSNQFGGFNFPKGWSFCSKKMSNKIKVKDLICTIESPVNQQQNQHSSSK